MGISSALGSSALLPAGLGFRNLIINGGMTIDQRGCAGTPITNTGGSTKDDYFLDRWHMFGTLGSKMTGTQVTVASLSGTAPSDPFQQTMKLTSASSTFTPASNAAYGIRQYVEGSNITGLGWGTSNARQLVLTFWVRSSLTGTYNVSIFNNGNDRSYVQSYTINSANTWEKKTLYFTGDSSGTWLMTTGIGLKVWWDLGSGSDFNTTAGAWQAALKTNTSAQANWVGQNAATFFLTGVQLEQNYQPTPFEQRPIGVELQLCQRYYWRFKQRAGGVFDQVAAAGITVSTTQVNRCTISLPVPTRRQVTNADVAVNAISIYDGTSIVSVTSAAATSMDVGATMMGFDATCGGILATGRPSVLIFTNDTGYFAVNQEL